ncbi:hypothetical protein DFJ63DRAFT_311512 [Scheffersomyces coipomensis]|uniref:uncharacterized protein n=1 Tax=Scheffersomyces coipomensis TaxID=1788519 RepID=UPI00315D9CA5
MLLKTMYMWIFQSKINSTSDLLDLKQFLNKLGKPQTIDDVLQNLPISIESFKINDIQSFATQFNHLISLKTLISNNCSSYYLYTLPHSLENLTCFRVHFYNMRNEPQWPSNLKKIHLEFSRFSFFNTITFANWPKGLIHLVLRQNYAPLRISDLPECLKYLELKGTGATRYIQFTSPSDFGNGKIFPESLKQLKLSRVKFTDLFDQSIEFPRQLERLEISSCSIAWVDCIFPPTLTRLELCNITIRSLNEYNSKFKDWNQLVNLKYLSFKGSSLKCGLKTWLPPKSLKVLNLRNTNIRSLDIAMFKIINKEYTSNLTEIDVSRTSIKKIPTTFYLPCNVFQFDITGNRWNRIFFPVTIRNKIIRLYK